MVFVSTPRTLVVMEGDRYNSGSRKSRNPVLKHTTFSEQ